jgi:hypothetical protein
VILEEDFKALDPQDTGSFSTKAFVLRVSGDKKFDADLKMTKEQFFKFVLEILVVEDPVEEAPVVEAPAEVVEGEVTEE